MLLSMTSNRLDSIVQLITAVCILRRNSQRASRKVNWQAQMWKLLKLFGLRRINIFRL